MKKKTMKKNISPLIVFGILIFIIFYQQSCTEFEPKPLENNELLDGPMDGLTTEESRRFLNGDELFNENIFTVEKGLGPIFVATSCGSCHLGDGKGHPFTALTRFGQYDETGNHYLEQGGRQLQDKAIPGYQPETLPANVPFSRLVPPANTGLGLLEYVTDQDIIAMADPDDKDGDGISGVPNWTEIPDYVTPRKNAIEKNGKYICRFGKKASSYDLLHQTVDALSEDIGITSSYNPIDIYSKKEIDPEIDTKDVNDMVFYLTTLKAPTQRNQNDPDVKKGAEIFENINCSACHKTTLKTGNAPIEALSNKEFHPYTDLLLHDMGKGLDDGYTEGSAKTSEWRTPPLWGLGLSKKSQGGKYYLMHDGRANSIDESILLHGGEGEKSKKEYEKLNNEDKRRIIKFLESL